MFYISEECVSKFNTHLVPNSFLSYVGKTANLNNLTLPLSLSLSLSLYIYIYIYMIYIYVYIYAIYIYICIYIYLCIYIYIYTQYPVKKLILSTKPFLLRAAKVFLITFSIYFPYNFFTFIPFFQILWIKGFIRIIIFQLWFKLYIFHT